MKVKVFYSEASVNNKNELVDPSAWVVNIIEDNAPAFMDYMFIRYYEFACKPTRKQIRECIKQFKHELFCEAFDYCIK